MGWALLGACTSGANDVDPSWPRPDAGAAIDAGAGLADAGVGEAVDAGRGEPPAADASVPPPDAASGPDAGDDGSGPPTEYSILDRLDSPPAEFLDYFGEEVVVGDDGRLVVVGSPYHGASSKLEEDFMRGAAYVYRRAGAAWELRQALDSPLPRRQGRFGGALALFEELLVIAEPGAGKVHVYEPDDDGRWLATAVLTPARSDDIDDSFGHAVAADGDTIVVGTFMSPSLERPGVAYVFERRDGEWISTAVLGGSDGHPDDRFGHRVLLEQGRLFVSAYGHKDGKGAVYEFGRGPDGAWRQTAMLTAPDEATDEDLALGSAMAFKDDTLLVGAIHAGGVSPGTGAAYLFRWDGGAWRPAGKLVDPGGAFGDLFGMAVAVAGSHVFVGSPRSFVGMAAPGAVFAFEEIDDGTWTLREKLLPWDPEYGSDFGYSLSVSGAVMVAGAPKTVLGTLRSGSAYLLDIGRAL